MYSIYFEQPRTQLSLNDYLQLQAVLRQEQAEREHRLLQEYKKEQERRRIEKAMYKLQVMTELYRQREQEERAIQAYYAAKKEVEQRRRQQQLIAQEHKRRILLERQRQQQEYLAALQQRQELEEQCQLMARAIQQQQQQQQQQKSAEYANPLHALATAAAACSEDPVEEESESESEAEDESSRQIQLDTLVRLIFGAQDDATPEVEEKPEEEEHQEEQSEQKQEGQEHNTTVMNLDQFVDYISRKAQSLDDEESEEEQEECADHDEDMEEDTAMLAIEHIDDNESTDDDESMDEDDFEHIEHEEDLLSAAVEHLDDTEEDEEVPALVESAHNIQELVNDILTNSEENDDEASPFPTEDPVKIAKYDALHRIERELNEIRQNHEDKVLHAVLDFSDALNNEDRAASPEHCLITATTAANREFLGYEDQIMKALLKLDMIQSDGDEDIRNKRKALVKLAEGMLDKLDEFKQREWERVSCSSHSEDEDMYM